VGRRNLASSRNDDRKDGITMTEEIRDRDTAVTPRGINHIVLHVRDIEESHRFWCDTLGFQQVGTLKPREGRAPMAMRFYSGVVDDVNHHDLALIENPALQAPSEEWQLGPGPLAINHIAITYPDRTAWLEQVKFMEKQGVKMNLRVDHGMTHSVYVNDPNGYGVEVLYELPHEVWKDDIDGALNYAVRYPREQLLQDTTDYVTDFSSH
jgi:catechol 2,3-dioxygenase-like lactoylglutathione lyase family enzyme